MVGPKLASFVIYNPTYGPKEGQEHLKILYYHPENEDSDVKVNNVGLCEAFVQFTKTYSPNEPCESVHTQKHRQVFYEAEPEFWIVMTVSNPWKELVRDGQQRREYQEEDVKDIVLQAVLKRAYFVFRLFLGTFQSIVDTERVEGLKKKLKDFFSKYVPDIDIKRNDIMDVHNGIEFLSLDKSIYLKIQSFLNLIKASFPQVQYTMMLYDDKAIWSGLERDDSRTLFSYLVNKLLPTSSEFESSAISSYLTRDGSYGRFLAGVRYYEHTTDRHMTTIFVNSLAKLDRMLMVAYQVLNITVCLLIRGDSPPSVDMFRRMDASMGKPLITFATEIERLPQKPAESADTMYKYIYFNRESLSTYSSCHTRDSNGFVSCSMPPDVMKVVLNICTDLSKKNSDAEVITKASTDYWVVAKKKEQHECYIVISQKNANLIEVNEEVKKICLTHIPAVTLTE